MKIPLKHITTYANLYLKNKDRNSNLALEYKNILEKELGEIYKLFLEKRKNKSIVSSILNIKIYELGTMIGIYRRINNIKVKDENIKIGRLQNSAYLGKLFCDEKFVINKTFLEIEEKKKKHTIKKNI